MGDTLSILEQLVAIDTTSATSNLPLIEQVEGFLADHGVASRRLMDASGKKAGLVARIGPDREGGVVVCAHTDCVPVAGQPWSRDPFTLTRVGSRLFGRGTADMKGFLAAVLQTVPAMVAADLQRPVILALSRDEELGALGAADLVRALLDDQPRPTAAIVGEPTSMRIVNAHKGVRAFTTTVTGRDGHSSRPQHAANAVAAAARIATFIDELASRHRDGAADARFDPPYTTFNLATISGGQAINIVPRRCRLTWEYRPVPADDNETIRRQVDAFVEREVLPRLRVTYARAEVATVTDAILPSLDVEEDGAAEALVRDLTGSRRAAGTVPFGTDGGHLQAAGISTVVCGPGAIDQAHQPDEFIEVDQLEAAERFLADLVSHLSRR